MPIDVFLLPLLLTLNSLHKIQPINIFFIDNFEIFSVVMKFHTNQFLVISGIQKIPHRRHRLNQLI